MEKNMKKCMGTVTSVGVFRNLGLFWIARKISGLILLGTTRRDHDFDEPPFEPKLHLTMLRRIPAFKTMYCYDVMYEREMYIYIYIICIYIYINSK